MRREVMVIRIWEMGRSQAGIRGQDKREGAGGPDKSGLRSAQQNEHDTCGRQLDFTNYPIC